MFFRSTNLAYENIKNKRKNYKYSHQENKFITEIKKNTVKFNVDNVSRTEAYANFFYSNPEIKWSFLASMVSRNAGWNMTDLKGRWFTLALDEQQRDRLFFTYERANWIIFQDAYPQLLLYELSKKLGTSLFHLLHAFSVSVFMEQEWEVFWSCKNEERLVTSLIINEQNMIDHPVIKNPSLQKDVFQSLAFILQDIGHFSCVVFPTLDGELYGHSVYHFKNINNRILLGKQLSNILFHPELFMKFYSFSKKTVHTGSRYDYEKYLHKNFTRQTPFLRVAYDIVQHVPVVQEDWVFKQHKKISNWNAIVEEKAKHPNPLTHWFLHKQNELHGLIALNNWVLRDKR
ncbi:DUF2515 family protein [Bacillus alkalisoli]|uniref:DUF2515 family protein n=1 Tax=Bacillus alkalisoli TaxID=2011008 RepID=UPI0038738231